jgi:TolB-like protein
VIDLKSRGNAVPNSGVANRIDEEKLSAPDEASVRTQLARIAKSRDFDVTDRTRKFLAYVVEEALAGRGDRIKAYSIATDVFGRDASFDAHSDPIVRVEAGHLRRALEHFYLTAGKTDSVVISVPKGSYAPVFESHRPEFLVAPPEKVSLWRRVLPIIIVAAASLAVVAWVSVERMRSVGSPNPDIPRLLVKPFDDLTKSASSQTITRGLTQEIIGQIAKFKDIVTVEGGSGENDLRASAAPGIRYALVGGVNIGEDTIRLQAHVLNLADGAVLWANNYDGDLRASKVVEIENDIARQVATALGQPYGVIFQADVAQRPRNPPDDWQAYACTLSYYAYRVNLDPKIHPVVRKCLEEAVSRFPTFATGWALLSQTYIDEIRFRFAADLLSSPSSIDRALAAARRAVELDPDNVRALEAEMFSLYFHGDIEAALRVGEQALRVNPNDTELIGEYGYRLALSGNWERGCALMNEARERNPGPLSYYESGLALCSYFRGDYREAAMWIKKRPTPENPNYHLIAAVIYGEGGETEDAYRERDWLTAHAPNLLANIRPELARRIARKEDIDRLIGSMRKAGLPLSDK